MCSISGCTNKYRSIGLCSSHWKINKKYGTPTPLCWCGEPAQTNGGNQGASLRCKEHTLADRFWDYVDIKGKDECWEWKGSKTAANYGLMWFNGELQYAHRLSLEMDGRPVPSKWYACHRCDNPPCVNPKHLFPGSPRDNSLDMVSKNRHLHGETHPFAKLSSVDVDTIRQMAEENILLVEIAEQFGIHPSYVATIVNRYARRNG